MTRLAISAVFAALAAVGLSACGELDQTTHYSNGAYRGKPDTRPWENAPLAAGGDWDKGDRAGWQTQLRARQGPQNEYGRIGH